MEHICEQKGADQLRGDRISNQLFDFRFTESTLPLPPFSFANLCCCTTRLLSGLVGNRDDRFCRDVAQ